MEATKVSVKKRKYPDIFYEDPEPVEDGVQQFPAILKLAALLRRYFRKSEDVFVDGGGYIAFDRTDGNRRVAPDCYITFGVDADAILETGNYFLWEVGKPPEFAMEVASDSTAANDLGFKRELYARLGIAEYWRFDPTGGDRYGQPLMGEQLVNGEYRPVEQYIADDGSLWSYSEVLGLQFHWSPELEDSFDIRDPSTGRTIDMEETEREARLVEREARMDVEARAEADRLAAQARERELLAQVELLQARLEERRA